RPRRLTELAREPGLHRRMKGLEAHAPTSLTPSRQRARPRSALELQAQHVQRLFQDRVPAAEVLGPGIDLDVRRETFALEARAVRAQILPARNVDRDAVGKLEGLGIAAAAEG